MKQYKDTPYFITDDGKVFRNGKEIKGGLTKKGYKKIIMCFDKKVHTFSTHRLVGELYLDNPDNKPQINHIDGNKLNNHYTNLEWVTNQENCNHRDNILNKKNIGEKSSMAKLTEDEAIYIKENYQSRHPDFGSTPLSKRFGVTNRTILSIANNERWKHL